MIEICPYKTAASVPIFGHSGDLLDEKGLDSARVWLSAVDVLFHSNVSLADHGLEGLEYLPYTCSRARYFAAERKSTSFFQALETSQDFGIC